MIYAFGDSYCACSYYVFQGKHDVKDGCHRLEIANAPTLDSNQPIKRTKSYLDYLSDLTGQEVGHLGTPGRGPLDMVNNFYEFRQKKDPNQDDILIFCWSGMDRDIDKWGDPYIDPEFDNTRYEGTDIQRYKDAVSLYHLYLYSPMQHQQSMLSCLLAIDGMLDNVLTRNIFHFCCFENEWNWIDKNYTISNGFYEKQWSLYDYAHSFEDYGTNGIDDLEYPNHFSPQGSIALAEHINEKIIN